MAERTSWWHFVKQRVLPVAMVLVLGLVAFDTCRDEAHEVTIVVELEDGAAARSLRVDYVRDGEPDPVGHMEQRYGAGGAPGPATHTLKLDPGRYTARIRVETDAGAHTLERHFHVRDEATVKLRVPAAP